MTVLLATTGGVLVETTIANAPLLQQAAVQKYAYRALQSGVDAFANAINADPYLAACNTTSNSAPQCSGFAYGEWSVVPDTNTGSGVVPEYYLVDNPQQVTTSSGSVAGVEVQVVGAAGFPGHVTYQSTIADFVPANGFLDSVWWSNYESFNPATQSTNSAYGCGYYWSGTTDLGGSKTPYSLGSNSYGQTVGGTPCVVVNFGPSDQVYGPLYSNDSLFVQGAANFGTTSSVQTQDPNCLFVDPSSSSLSGPPGCSNVTSTDGVTYDTTGSSYGHVAEPLPTANSELATLAQDGGCYYTGPTTITFGTTGTAPDLTGTMTVSSPDTASVVDSSSSSPTYKQSVSKYGLHTYDGKDYGCPVSGTSPLPPNGVLYVDSGGAGTAGSNPFDGQEQTSQQCVSYSWSWSTGPTCSQWQTVTQLTGVQTLPTCKGCYYGQTSSPDTEGDAFVSGPFAGQLTIGAANNIIVDGNITYQDCTFATSPIASGASTCKYNASNQTNDTLGLIAQDYLEVDNPVTGTPSSGGQLLPACGTSGALAPPLCNPSNTASMPAADGATAPSSYPYGLTIDATLLALQDSFVVNNYELSGGSSSYGLGTLNVYGSIQQNARGPIGTFGYGETGYTKYYLWDPRLELYGPPHYLNPGTGSWALASSSVETASSCPPMTPVDTTPQQQSSTFPDFTTGTACPSLP